MRFAATFLVAAILLTTIAGLRPPEYDEAYSLFLTTAHARPPWPTGVFTPAAVRPLFSGHPTFAKIATDLRTGDVHPPLYFWLLDEWRHLTNPSWFTARLLSVLISLAGLAALASSARLMKIPVIPTILITLLAYGFAYTSITARGFALAQALNLTGLALIRRPRNPQPQPSVPHPPPSVSPPLRHSRAGGNLLPHLTRFLAGLAFSLASFTNYLAIFPALGILAAETLKLRHGTRRDATDLAFTILGLVILIPADLYFFLSQRASRTGQFTPFHLGHALKLLAEDQAAALFGGLPLYAGKFAPLVITALAALGIMCLIAILKHRTACTAPLAIAAAAPPLGLLSLGIIFNNTPIEIRYCAFGLPFIGLLCAQIKPARLRNTLIFTESLAIIGLALAPATAQPQAAAAAQAPPGILILLPIGNDGVGIPGPFIAAARPQQPIILIHDALLPDLSAEPRVTLATLGIDHESKAAVANIEAELARHWRLVAQTPLTRTYQQRGLHQQP